MEKISWLWYGSARVSNSYKTKISKVVKLSRLIVLSLFLKWQSVLCRWYGFWELQNFQKTTLKVKAWALLARGHKPGDKVRRKNALGRRHFPGTFPNADQDELLHPGPLDTEHGSLEHPFGHASPFLEAAGRQELICCGQWLLSKSWNTARGSAMAVLLQQVLLGSSRCYKSERNLFLEWGDASH